MPKISLMCRNDDSFEPITNESHSLRLDKPARHSSATDADISLNSFCFRVPKSVESDCLTDLAKSGKLSSDGGKDAGEPSAGFRRFPATL